MAGINQGAQVRLAQSQQQLFQTYLATNRTWLDANYPRYRAAGGQMSYLDFARWGLTTANGTNIAGAVQMQRGIYDGNAAANRTVQEGFASYNAGAAANSAAISQTLRNYDQEAIRGNAPYVDPASGQTRWLPFAPAPGRPFTSGGETYVQRQDGTYFQQRGNAWVPLQQAR